MSSNNYQHRFDSVEGYLHHRAPYLLVERIVELEDEFIRTTAEMTGDEHFARGHFPGLPIFPGAMMQELTTQTAGILIAANYNPMETYDTEDPEFNEVALGVLVRVKKANYKRFVRPGNVLDVHVVLEDRIADIFQFSATITVESQVVMSNSFQLANIPTDQLRGQ